MRGDGEVIALLNEQLTSELTAINRKHSAVLWGVSALA